MDRIEAMRAFTNVVNEGSFTKAALKLDLSNQLVSKYVSQLEAHLGIRLLNRTTRKVRLTEAGERCFQQASLILENVQDMEGYVDELQGSATGVLRISAPVSFATRHMPKLIQSFRRKYPRIQIDLQLNDRKVDVVDEGFDLALRIGHLKSSSLIARKITPIRLVICASPSYLKQHGTPKTPQDLIPEHYLRYSYMEYSETNTPLFNALKTAQRLQAAPLTCNNGEILASAAAAGEGYAMQPTFIVGKALKEGKLLTILNAFEPQAVALYAVYPHRKLTANKVSVFLDFMSDYFGDKPYWDSF